MIANISRQFLLILGDTTVSQPTAMIFLGYILPLILDRFVNRDVENYITSTVAHTKNPPKKCRHHYLMLMHLIET